MELLKKCQNAKSQSSLSLVPSTASNVQVKQSKQEVLNEESYTDTLEKIIQRDFFPDFSKLRAQNEYLEALETNNVVKLRELQIKYCSRRSTSRPGSSLSTLFNTPSTFETPQKDGNATPTTNPEFPGSKSNRPLKNKETLLTLDQFLGKFTSEDNASFSMIMVEAARKHQQKYPWLYHDESKEEETIKKALTLPTVEQQAVEGLEKPSITMWSYKNQNPLMYVPKGVELTSAEKVERSQKREVIHANTRFEQVPFNETVNKATLAEAASVQAKNLEGKIGIDGRELIPKDTPNVNGYGFVPSTPSPAPGVMDSPLMTWGEIEGTPFRLDGSDTPIPRTPGGPQFKIPDITSRERLAHSLADKVSKKSRTKKEEAIKRVQSSFLTPSPTFGGNTPRSPMSRLSTMSEAAQRLACAKLGIHRSSDKALMASYTPSPSRTPLRDGTPSSGASTPTIITTPVRKRYVDPMTLTDDLLNLSSLQNKRSKASEFF